nr:hypothetical protein [Ensifer adhaerens]
MAWLVHPKRRAEDKIAIRYIVDHDRGPLRNRLAQKAFAGTNRRRQVRLGGHTTDTRPLERTTTADEDRSRNGAGIGCKEVENVVAQLLDRLIAHHR